MGSIPAFEKLTGYSRGEAIGKNPRILKSGKQDAEFYRELWDRILSGKVWQGEVVNKRKDGELYTEEMTITPVLDESRRVGGFIAIKSDMTERMRLSRRSASWPRSRRRKSSSGRYTTASTTTCSSS
jgi:PAS domain S-box-containing protein